MHYHELKISDEHGKVANVRDAGDAVWVKPKLDDDGEFLLTSEDLIVIKAYLDAVK